MPGRGASNTRTGPGGDVGPPARRWWPRAISRTRGGEFLYQLPARERHDFRIGHRTQISDRSDSWAAPAVTLGLPLLILWSCGDTGSLAFRICGDAAGQYP